MSKIIDKDKQMDELRDLAQPLHDWLQKNFHPHATIVIDYDGAHVYEALLGVPQIHRENPILQPEKK